MQYNFDYLVIGSGIAGLNFVLEAAKSGTVAIVTKKELMESNSNYAQGGIAAVLDKHDSFAKHIKDTLQAGCYLNDKKAVSVMVKEGPKQIQRLIEFGVGFNRERNKLNLTKEGGHSFRRIANAKDTTGKEIERALVFNVRHHKNIFIFESHLAIDLIINKGKCLGVLVLDDEQKKIKIFNSKITALATGGAGQVYQRNCNPKIATGDGLAMAQRAGAVLRDMEFIQFHPTALNKKSKPILLISESLRGEGAFLVNSQKEKFMSKYHSLVDLAPRDIVSRAVYEELKKGSVYLDIRHKGSAYIKHRFPYLYNELWWCGIKMDKELIPIAPAAHYVCGGVHTNLNGQTNIANLFAFGEVAHTGVHGGNRLASNSLLECVVFSYRAAKAAKNIIKNFKDKDKTKIRLPKVKPLINGQLNIFKKEIQKIMWQNVGIAREYKKMIETLERLKNIEKETNKLYSQGVNRKIIELRNLVQVAILITSAALIRKQSVCAHYLTKKN